MTEQTKHKIRVEAAISAMQGILESGSIGTALEVAPKIVAKLAIRMADALIDELDNSPKNN